MSNAGKFDKFVSILRNDSTTNQYKEKIDNWVEIDKVFCSIETPSAKEINQNKDIQVDSVTIKMWLRELTHANAIRHESHLYLIQSVIRKKDHLVIAAILVHDL